MEVRKRYNNRHEVFRDLDTMLERLEDNTTSYSGYEKDTESLREGIRDLLDQLEHVKVRRILKTDAVEREEEEDA